jgi:hypothetical protein
MTIKKDGFISQRAFAEKRKSLSFGFNYRMIENLRYCVQLKNFSLDRCRDVTIAGEGLPSLGLCLALRAFERGEIFIVPHLL